MMLLSRVAICHGQHPTALQDLISVVPTSGGKQVIVRRL